jgi:hypothetical protein
MTPPPPVQPEQVFATPQRSQDLYKARKQLERSERLSRAARFLVAKAGKAISLANTRAAELQAGNIRLQAQLDLLKIKKPRKKVHPNPNEQFADVEAIKRAVDEAATKAAAKAAKSKGKKAAVVPTQLVATPLDSMCTQFQT